MKRSTLPSLALATCIAGAVGCSAPGPASTTSGAPSADIVTPPSGIEDRGLDPAVVAVDVAGALACAGALVAPDVVLTARRCVVEPCASAPREPASLRVRLGDDLASAPERARGRAFVTPDDPCAADVALVLLDRPIEDVQPLPVRTTGAAQGDHVRAVGFARAGVKWVRDHLAIVDTSSTDLRVRESGADDPTGGPALDETTGEIVGVVSGAEGADAGTALRTYARADAAFALVRRALAASFSAGTSARRTGVLRATKGPADMGANCETASDCAAGVCVSHGPRRYCSRACDAHDHCPTHFRCQKSQEGAPVCVES